MIHAALEPPRSAKAPVMIVGGGVILSEATSDAIAVAEYLRIPVITTYMAKGGIPDDHPLNAEHMGIQVGATAVGNKVFLDSDVVMGVSIDAIKEFV